MKCELYQFSPQVYPFNLWIYVGKDVYVMGERLKKVCVMRDMKDVYVMGERLRMFM